MAFLVFISAEQKSKLYSDINDFSNKVEKDEYFENYKGSLSKLNNLQTAYIKNQDSIFYAEEFINIGLNNRNGFEFLTDLINTNSVFPARRVIELPGKTVSVGEFVKPTLMFAVLAGSF